MAFSNNKPWFSLMSLGIIQLCSTGVWAAVTSPPGCSIHQIGPGRPSPSVNFSDSLVISNLILQQGGVSNNLQVHLQDESGISRAEVFIKENGEMVMNNMPAHHLLAGPSKALPQAPSELYWQHLVLNNIGSHIIIKSLEDKGIMLYAADVGKISTAVINSSYNSTVALHCILVPAEYTIDPVNGNITTYEEPQKTIFHWRESIAWGLLLLSMLSIIFLCMAFCMRRRAITSLQSIVPSFTKFLKRTSSHHPREPSNEMKSDINLQIKREPEEASDPSEISTTGNYIEELQPPSYTTQITELNSVSYDNPSIDNIDHYHKSKVSSSLSHTSNLSHAFQSSSDRSRLTEESSLPFDSRYESQNMQSIHSQELSNVTHKCLTNSFNKI
ncbi:unnamed protein product [Meganyctiphanes norvegica]|uniref:Uncharacterized protein n=1 Tax=Meganyctiphanes norvegica TaxID=48144 RepID=A0AAV2QFH9_MEGNR